MFHTVVIHVWGLHEWICTHTRVPYDPSHAEECMSGLADSMVGDDHPWTKILVPIARIRPQEFLGILGRNGLETTYEIILSLSLKPFFSLASIHEQEMIS